MRKKKLARQLRKMLDRPEFESEVPQIQTWFNNIAKTPWAPPAMVQESMYAMLENFSIFLDTVEASYDQLENNLGHAQRSLELSSQEVEERNKQLRAENKKVSDLLNNMRQAVFSVGRDGSIVAPVSRFADEVFGRKIVGLNFFDVVYPELDGKSEAMASLKSASVGVFGESSLQWDLLEEYFPRRATIDSKAGEDAGKILKISVSPIWDDEENCERIMFIVEDVTAVEKLERRMVEERAKSNRTMSIIQELVGVGRPQLVDFLGRSSESVTEVRHSLDPAGASPDFDLVFRQLHTVKGNARGYKFHAISGAAHRVESLIAPCRGAAGATEWQAHSKEILVELSALQEQISEYSELARKVLGVNPGRAGASAESAGVDEGVGSAALVRRLRTLSAKLKTTIKHPLVAELDEALDRANDVPLRSSFDQLKTMALDLASELHKRVDVEILDAQDLTMDPKIANAVQDALMHIVRNAVDHGLEAGNDRKNFGKSEIGKIVISCSERNGVVEIEVADDGRGLDSAAIGRRAIDLGLATAAEISSMHEADQLKLIFKPGFTTKKEVTAISGRGAGLDAAREEIQRFGGRIDISTLVGSGTMFRIALKSRGYAQAVGAA